MKNIVIRALSGAVYVGLIVAALLLLDRSAVMFLVVFSLLTCMGITEACGLLRTEDEPSSWLVALVDMLGGVGLLVGGWLVAEGMAAHGVWLLPLAFYLPLRCIVQLYRPRQNALHSLARSFFALAYVALPLTLLNAVVTFSSPRALLAVFIFIWLNDTGAFLVGVAVGRHRLFERVSPKKSWEGFFGGLLVCVGGAAVMHTWFGEFFEVPALPLWVGLAVVVCLAATFGDLTESLLKRAAGVKDSGNVIPGHGGVLDRIDSLLLVSPAVLAYLVLLAYNHAAL